MPLTRALLLFLCLAISSAAQQADEEPRGNQAPPPEFSAYATVSEEIAPPELVRSRDPRYTRQARRAQVEGVMTLWVGLGANGRVERVAVRTPLGYGLDEAAMKAVRRWRFKPARKEGRPVPVLISVEVDFRLPS